MAATRSGLIEALVDHVGTTPLTESEIEACLALAAVAAHGTATAQLLPSRHSWPGSRPPDLTTALRPWTSCAVTSPPQHPPPSSRSAGPVRRRGAAGRLQAASVGWEGSARPPRVAPRRGGASR